MTRRSQRTSRFFGGKLTAIWFAITFSFGSAALGQVTSGTIAGTVTDETGARVPGASISIVNTGTSIVSSAMTDQNGYYTAPSLVVGQYQVTAKKSGFATGVRSGIDLTVGREAVVDTSLKVGNATEQVVVTGDAPLIETTDSTVGALISSEQVRDVPLNGRELQQLILLTPGVNQVNGDGPPGTYTHGNSSTFSASGLRPVGMMELLDGANVSNFYKEGAGNTTANTSLGVEAVDQFETLTSTYSAEFGGQGAVVNMASRSGTNQMHGSAYLFDRDSIFNANNYVFPNSTPAPNPFHKVQFGGSAGGPIRKDKTFFFANYEGLRASIGLTAPGITLNNNARAGNVPCTTAPTYPCVNGLANVGVAPSIANVLKLYPAVTGTDNGNGTANFTGAASTTQNENYFLGRVDHHFSDKDSIFSSYVWDTGHTLAATVPVTGYGSKEYGRNQYLTLQENHVLSSSLLNVADLHWVRLVQQIEPQTTGADSPALDAFGPAFAATTISTSFGVNAIGGGTILAIAQSRFALSDHVYWTLGKHALKFGLDANKIIGTVYEPLSSYGSWSFLNLPNLLQNIPQTIVGPIETNGVAGNAERSLREYEVVPFLADDWHLNPHLTLNIGLRYSYVTNPTDSTNRLYNLVNPLSDATYTHVSQAFGSNPSTRDFDPRFGFAYTPFDNKGTSIRGGFGIFHDLIEPREVLSYVYNYPYVTATLNTYTGAPGQTLYQYPNIPPASISKPVANLTPNYQNTHSQYAMERNLNIQQQIARGAVLSIGYEGSTGIHLPVTYENNMYPYTGTYADGRPTRVGATVPLNPNAGTLLLENWNGTSRYDSLQASVRVTEKTLQSLLAYTWGKCIDIMSLPYSGDNLGGSANVIFDGMNLKDSRGRCDYNPIQTFNGNVLYSPPLHNVFAKGFQIGVIGNVHTGLPFTPLATTNSDDIAPLGSSAASTPPDRVQGVSPQVGRQINKSGYLTWFNPAAFTPQPYGVVGNAGRNSLIGPKLVDFDTSLAKNVPLHFWSEKASAQFRWEVFNVFNHPNFALPSGQVFSGTPTAQGNALTTAGRITAVSGYMRQMQFAVKILF
jgi:hypothetical protein